MNKKKCIFCNQTSTKKKGFNINKEGKRIQKYYCKNCKKIFQENRKAPLNKEELFYFFSFHKQTLAELSKVYHIKRGEVQQVIDEYVLPVKIHNGREVHLQIDATYFGTRENQFCLILFRDPIKKENLWWRFCDVEKEIYYLEGKRELEKLGYTIKSITADGLPLFKRVFRNIPYQMCLIHMERIIIRQTTRKPILEAGKVLYSLSKKLSYIQEEKLNRIMYGFTLKYWTMLNQKTYHEETGEWWWTHERLRKAYLSLQNYQDYLFTYTKDKNISKNTNSIEATFGNIKNKLKVHNGLSVKRKQKLIEIFLLNGSGVFAYEDKKR